MRTHVYLIGSGPGDPGLLTCKGRDLVSRADVIVYDYLASGALLGLARPDAELIYVGKKGYERHVTQEEINRIIVEKALELDERMAGGPAADEATCMRDRTEGSRTGAFPVIARLKGGDPFVFGRGGEEALALAKAGVPFEIVPGVTSGIAAPAYAGIPVTHRKVASSVTFITGNEDPTRCESSIDWGALAALVRAGDTVCFYMGMRNLPGISANLIERGARADTPVALVQWGTTASQRTLTSTLADVAADAEAAGMAAPVMIVVGQVVGLRESIAWLEDRPLHGRRIMVTRSRDQAGALTGRLAELGADVYEFPTIETCDPVDPEPLNRAIEGLDAYDWVVFTSANGVERFFARLAASSAPMRDARALAGARVAAIGPATAAALAARGITADVVPGEYRAEAVFDALLDARLRAGDRVLIPRAEVAREVLPQKLAAFGCSVDVAPAYATRKPAGAAVREMSARLAAHEIDAVTFTSSSTASNLADLLGDAAGELLKGAQLFSIGPITSSTMRELGLEPTAQASRYTIGGLVETIVGHYASKGTAPID